MNKNKRYAFYGSLRKGMYNYEHFATGMTYDRTVQVPGFRLFSLGPYPTVCKTDNEKDVLTVDLFTLNSETERRINNMELGAGYQYEEFEVDGERFGIYTYDLAMMGRLADRYVPSGDWVKHLQPGIAEAKEV